MKSALLVIDMVNGMEQFIPGKRIERIIPNMEKLIERARKKKVQIIYAIHTPLGRNGIEIYPELLPKKGDVIVKKKKYSCFYETNLDKILKQKKVKRVIVTGISTHWCVLTTGIDLDYRGYRTIIVRDCVSAPTDFWHKYALDWMANTFENASIENSSGVKF